MVSIGICLFNKNIVIESKSLLNKGFAYGSIMEIVIHFLSGIELC